RPRLLDPVAPGHFRVVANRPPGERVLDPQVPLQRCADRRGLGVALHRGALRTGPPDAGHPTGELYFHTSLGRLAGVEEDEGPQTGLDLTPVLRHAAALDVAVDERRQG